MNTKYEKMPVNIDAERFVLGAIQLQGELYIQAAGELTVDDFSLDNHRKIFRRMGDIHERGESIGRISVANELMKFSELESVGLGYLGELDTGLPILPNIDSYVRMVKEKSALRRIIFAAQHMMNRAMVGEDTAEEILASGEESLLNIGADQIKSGPMSPTQIVEAYEGGISAFLTPSLRAKGVSTGYVKFDEWTSGLHPGDLFILAARPSMGKTALALNIAQNAAVRSGKRVVVFSLEMSRESLLTRMMCATARVDSQKFRMGYLNQEERRRLNEAFHALSEAPLLIDDTAALHLMDMHAKLRRIKSENGKVDLVIVDYLQLMSGRGRTENRTQEVSALSRGLKIMAKDLGVPMIVLSQLNRAPEQRQGDHRPVLSDLRESGSIEQDADLVAFIFREEVYQRDREDLRGLAELILAKQRNGPVGTINLIFLHAQTKFENRAEDTGESASD